MPIKLLEFWVVREKGGGRDRGSMLHHACVLIVSCSCSLQSGPLLGLQTWMTHGSSVAIQYESTIHSRSTTVTYTLPLSVLCFLKLSMVQCHTCRPYLVWMNAWESMSVCARWQTESQLGEIDFTKSAGQEVTSPGVAMETPNDRASCTAQQHACEMAVPLT